MNTKYIQMIIFILVAIGVLMLIMSFIKKIAKKENNSTTPTPTTDTSTPTSAEIKREAHQSVMRNGGTTPSYNSQRLANNVHNG